MTDPATASNPADEPHPEDDATEDSSATDSAGGGDAKRRRRARGFPAMSFTEALALAEGIQLHGAGQPIRRTTLFEAWQKAPDSGHSRQLITSSGQYKITTGAYNAETLALTALGKIASDPSAPEARKLRARFDLAILGVAPFKSIYERYVGSRLPTVEVLRDAASDAGVEPEHLAECVETFLANARDIGIIRNIAGAEHLVSIDAAMEVLGVSEEAIEDAVVTSAIATSPRRPARSSSPGSAEEDLSNVCFVVSPIGDADSVERKHADLVLGALIEPALVDLGLVAVRADRISRPGLITGQVMDHIARAKLVIADLSFGNPNVFYELALRHATRKPTVQLLRRGDKLPFDVGQYRTVELDMTDIYSLVPKIDLYRQEITRQARAAVAEGTTSESPLSQFYPRFWDHIATS